LADEFVIDTGQFDRFRVISPSTLHKGLNGGIDVEDQAVSVSIRIMLWTSKKDASRKPRVNRRKLASRQSTRWLNGGVVP
jgi:hypothetical protein